MPLPRGLDNAVNARVQRSPTQNFADLLRAGNQHCRVPGASRTLHYRNGVAGYPSCNVDDLSHAEAIAASEVADQLRMLFKSVECEQVGGCQVIHVNEIADAG